MIHYGNDFEPVRIGLIGCGKISDAYLKAARNYPILNLVACADIDPTASERISKQYGLVSISVDDLLTRNDIEVILNLTVPRAHASVNIELCNQENTSIVKNRSPLIQQREQTL